MSARSITALVLGVLAALTLSIVAIATQPSEPSQLAPAKVAKLKQEQQAINVCLKRLPARLAQNGASKAMACRQLTEQPADEHAEPPPEELTTGYANGRLPKSALAPVAGGRLAKRPAAALNAMNVKARRSCGLELRPTGPLSTYRNLAGQQYLYHLFVTGQGNLAAYPGTSNHGIGWAEDFATSAMWHCIARIGRPYGWCKCWSDAPSEPWHHKWREGVWRGRDPGPRGRPARPTLRRGYVKPRKYTRLAQRKLAACGYPSVKRKTHYGRYDQYTRIRVKRFQKRKRLRANGVVGAATWRRLEQCR